MITPVAILVALLGGLLLLSRRAERPVLKWGLLAGVAFAAPSALVFSLGLPEAGNLFIALVQVCWATVLYFVVRRVVKPEVAERAGRGPGYLEQTVGLMVVLLGAAGMELLVTGHLIWLGAALTGTSLAAVLVVVQRTSGKAIIRYLASAEAATMVLTAILLATVAGTIVLQGLPPAELEATYGGLAPVLLALGVDDVFHSGALVGCLSLLALTSTVTVYHRRKSIIKWQHVGLLMSHIAVIMILLGGLIGWLGGHKGMLHLEVGQVASDYRLDATAEHPKGQQATLDFGVRLDHFELDNYVPEFRIYTYERNPEGDGFTTKASDAPEAGLELALPEVAGSSTIRVEKVYKRLVQETSWVADEAASSGAAPRPAARVTIAGDAHSGSDWVVSDGKRPGVYRDPARRFDLFLSWDEPSAKTLASLGGGTAGPATHTVQVAGVGPLTVELGGTYALPGGRKLFVRRFFPDFTYDVETKKPSTRSAEPKNPTLEVVVIGPGEAAAAADLPPVFLYASEEFHEMMGGKHTAATDLRYAYAAPSATAACAVVLVGSTGERLVVAGGEVVERVAVTWGESFAIVGVDRSPRVTVDVPLRRAVRTAVARDAADGPLKPAAEVVVTSPTGQQKRVTLMGKQGKPLWLDRDHPVVFKEKPDGIKNFISRLSILEQGEVVASQTIRVNHPMSWAGFDLYQANYDPKNPSYSGIKVVRDPGLTIVEIAFWILMFGVLHTVALRSWKPVWRRSRRRAANSGAAEVPA